MPYDQYDPKDAAAKLASADALVILAGAGMSADSGLPTFRDKEGFWNAFPMAKAVGVESFQQLAKPKWFSRNPKLAWGFYGKRLNDYRTVKPHRGYFSLLALAEKFPLGYRVLTTNVDGAFQRAGFDPTKVAEVHGSIHYVQDMYGTKRWPATDVHVELDDNHLAKSYPTVNGKVVRPNILMFDDVDWYGKPYVKAKNEVLQFVYEAQNARKKVAYLIVGAGSAIATLNYLASTLADLDDVIVRIDPSEHVPFGSERTNFRNLKVGGKQGLTDLYKHNQGKDFDDEEVEQDFPYYDAYDAQANAPTNKINKPLW